jgi:hypothetical protein
MSSKFPKFRTDKPRRIGTTGSLRMPRMHVLPVGQQSSFTPRTGGRAAETDRSYCSLGATAKYILDHLSVMADRHRQV